MDDDRHVDQVGRPDQNSRKEKPVPPRVIGFRKAAEPDGVLDTGRLLVGFISRTSLSIPVEELINTERFGCKEDKAFDKPILRQLPPSRNKKGLGQRIERPRRRGRFILERKKRDSGQEKNQREYPDPLSHGYVTADRKAVLRSVDGFKTEFNRILPDSR